MVTLKKFFLVSLLLVLGVTLIYTYNYVIDIQKTIFTKIEADKIKNVDYILKNIEDDIVKKNSIKSSKDLRVLLSNNEIRQMYENKLSTFISPNIKYIYILQKDKKDRFRFLLDGSKIDRARFYQKFDVSNIKYQELYASKTAQIIKQKEMQNLYLTYLYPIISKDKVIALISVDITTNIQLTILELIKPLETFFVILIILIFSLTLMSVFQLFYYFITRKKIFQDQLTKLFNRTYLYEISSTLNLQHYSLVMLDLDRFKTINDTYGHSAGDLVLSQSANTIKNSIRDNDILIRYGGEEFLLFIHDRNTTTSAHEICERIRLNISKELYSYDNHDIKMTVSIGIHENPSFEKNLNEAIKIADKMLYIAKTKGRDRVVVYNEEILDNSDLKSKDINFVKHALNDNRVVCHYQPIYDHIKGNIYKYEALVRIIDKNGDIISPIYFLPGLKHTNIHYKLTQKILEIVFEKFSQNNMSVSINMNFSDLLNEDIILSITTAFKKNHGLASRITFEILESDEIDNLELFKTKIKLLKSFGSEISIDDFGSGYSNFRTILDIEANYLKIDGSLIKNIDTNKKDFMVAESIIHFAKQSNMKTVAEFVHSKSVFEKLELLQVDYMQGYYISKPLSFLAEDKNLFT